jgi:hypothetical protein
VKASNSCARTFIFISFSFIAFLSSFFPAFFRFFDSMFYYLFSFFRFGFYRPLSPPFHSCFFCEHAGELHIIILLIEREFTKKIQGEMIT